MWADESESFGEQAKEGELTPDQRAYLEELRDAVYAIDQGEPTPVMAHPLAIARRPLDIGLKSLREDFAAILERTDEPRDRTLLVVHDEALNQLTRRNVFGVNNRQEALAEYERLMTSLEQTRYSVLLLNARNLRALKVTQPSRHARSRSRRSVSGYPGLESPLLARRDRQFCRIAHEDRPA